MQFTCYTGMELEWVYRESFNWISNAAFLRWVGKCMSVCYIITYI